MAALYCLTLVQVFFLGYMVHKLLMCSLGRLEEDDRDHYGKETSRRGACDIMCRRLLWTKRETRVGVFSLPSLPFLGRMQSTLHATRRTPHGSSRLVQALSAWLMKTRCAPSRHSRDARVYGHTTAVMHKLSFPPPYLFYVITTHLIHAPTAHLPRCVCVCVIVCF